MKKKRTQAFLIPILLSLPLLQMVAVMIVGEVYLRWTVVILSVLFYLLLATNCIFWYHLNRKIDEIRVRQKLDIVVLTTATLDGAKTRDYADDYFDYNSYGYGMKRDGLLLLISTE